MDTIIIIIFILSWLHGFLFLFFRKRNHKQLIKYLESFRGTLLSEYETNKLINRYTNFIFGTFESYPNELEYYKLYQDQEFNCFVRNSKNMRKYFLVVTPILFLSLFILDMLW